MKRLRLLIFFVLASYSPAFYADNSADQNISPEPALVYDWLIVGAGPAGIATLGVLCNLGIHPQSIMWVDAEFNVGRIGQFYQNVPANNKAGPFIDFVNQCAVFSEYHTESLDLLRAQNPTEYSRLGIIVPALQDITNFLRTKVSSQQGWLTQLHFLDDNWHATINGIHLKAGHVVLATGSHPRELDYGISNVIPLDQALDKNILGAHVAPSETIGVVGSSHSAVLVIKYLYELNSKKIINFYRSPLAYTIEMDGWNLNAYNGLKGATAAWAREFLDAQIIPSSILRVLNTEENRNRFLPECDKIIYAIGFERNDLPLENSSEVLYDDKTGVIAPRLFGIGIAFPEYYCDHLGNEDHRVGLTSFMRYIQAIVPQWVNGLGDLPQRSEKYINRRLMLEKFEPLFFIDIL